jgi:hypothetical protein
MRSMPLFLHRDGAIHVDLDAASERRLLRAQARQTPSKISSPQRAARRAEPPLAP